MKQIAFVLLMATLLLGCRTTREAKKETVKTTETAEMDTRADVKAAVNTNTEQAVVDKGTATETVEEVTTSTTLSKPDSMTGVQFPLTRTTTTRRIVRGEARNLKATTTDKSTEETELKTVDKSDFKSDTRTNTVEKTEIKDKTPAWLSLGVLFLILALSGLAYLVMKRYGLIK